MNQLFDKEGAIERYLNGTMLPTEKKEFMSRLEWDADLRRSVDTELLIGKAIRGDRSAIPAQPAESRARFLTMLATVAPEPASMATPETSAQQAATSVGTGKGSSMMNLLSGSGFVKGIVATLAGVAVTVGTVVYTSDSPQKSGDAALKERGTAIEMAQPSSTITAPEASLPGPAVVDQESSATPAEGTPSEGASLATRNREATVQEATAQPRNGTDAAAPMATASELRLKDSKTTPASPEKSAAKLSTEKNTASASHEQAGTAEGQSREIRQAQQRNKTVPVVTNDSVPVVVNRKAPIIKQ